MSELVTRIQNDLNAARKAQDRAATLLLGTILADIKNRRIELMRDLTDADVQEVLRRGIKRRRESVEMYEKGGRNDLVEKEGAEIIALEKYLPANVSDDEIRDAVRQAVGAGANTIGALMSAVMPRFKGRAEGATINRIAREELSRQG